MIHPDTMAREAVHQTQVTGDLFEVSESALKATDSLEGHPTWYCRTPIQLVKNDGSEIEAYAYILTQESVDELRGAAYTPVKQGDWVLWRQGAR